MWYTMLKSKPTNIEIQITDNDCIYDHNEDSLKKGMRRRLSLGLPTIFSLEQSTNTTGIVRLIVVSFCNIS